MKRPASDVIQYGERKAAPSVQQAFTFLVTFNDPDSVVSQLHKRPEAANPARRASTWQRCDARRAVALLSLIRSFFSIVQLDATLSGTLTAPGTLLACWTGKPHSYAVL